MTDPHRATRTGPAGAALVLLLLALGHAPAAAQGGSEWETRFEASGGTESATYAEGIAYYERLAEVYPEVRIRTFGATDAGPPLHLVMVSSSGEFDPARLRAQGKAILMINNAIHAGETDGVDATMMLVRDMVQNPDEYADHLDGVALGIIPFFNIGGVLNRDPWNRPNQNGPEEHGFRGNGQNYNLNRDFIKADTRNVWAFWEIFHYLDPDVFVDNHVSNGADFQHVLTQVQSQKDKLGGVLSEYLEEELWPTLESRLAADGIHMIPYVNAFRNLPHEGWSQFVDSPRYSTGYTALFHTIGFMPELHMLKPYDVRVGATYAFMDQLLRVMARDRARILELRRSTKESVKSQDLFPLDWEVDRSIADSLYFRGYEATYIPSEVTGEPRLYYDRDRPLDGWVPFYNTYRPSIEVTRPRAYVVPQAWHEVIRRLRANDVRMHPLQRDTTIEVEVYRIIDYSSRERPYEAHYLHDRVEVEKDTREMEFRAGDLVVPVDQWVNRFIVETLEPQGQDSFFRWNFFDSVLQRHEGYSSYVFEDYAAELLRDSTELRRRFEERKRQDPEFAGDARAQLDWIFQQSPYYEEEYLRYPVYRIPR